MVQGCVYVCVIDFSHTHTHASAQCVCVCVCDWNFSQQLALYQVILVLPLLSPYNSYAN